MSDDHKQVCTGACLFGKCPFDTCIKHEQHKKRAAQVKADMQILTGGAVQGVKADQTGCGIAVDIGTTTVVAYLYDLAAARQMAVASRINAQVTFGTDVISRIQYCMDLKDGLKDLREAIVTELNSLIAELLSQVQRQAADICRVVVTGNTTMLHLFEGLSPVSMGAAPFEAESTFGYFRKAADLGLAAGETEVYLADCISAFVGGDITTAILASGMTESDDLTLLLDIGTNGEVVLGNSRMILATSTAAGPAFEGAQLSCGMASVNGAVSSVDVMRGEVIFTTIGDTSPKGICGSGVVDAVALALRAGLIDETGRIAGGNGAAEPLRKYITETGGMPALKIADGIVITQRDIREIQTAKAAIAAGSLSLLHHAGVELGSVKRLYLAGGFGNYMVPENAVEIGLLPRELSDRIFPIGNAAGAGAVMALLSGDELSKCQKIKRMGRHVNLEGNPYFMEKYVDCMLFGA